MQKPWFRGNADHYGFPRRRFGHSLAASAAYGAWIAGAALALVPSGALACGNGSASYVEGIVFDVAGSTRASNVVVSINTAREARAIMSDHFRDDDIHSLAMDSLVEFLENGLSTRKELMFRYTQDQSCAYVDATSGGYVRDILNERNLKDNYTCSLAKQVLAAAIQSAVDACQARVSFKPGRRGSSLFDVYVAYDTTRTIPFVPGPAKEVANGLAGMKVLRSIEQQDENFDLELYDKMLSWINDAGAALSTPYEFATLGMDGEIKASMGTEFPTVLVGGSKTFVGDLMANGSGAWVTSVAGGEDTVLGGVVPLATAYTVQDELFERSHVIFWKKSEGVDPIRIFDEIATSSMTAQEWSSLVRDQASGSLADGVYVARWDQSGFLQSLMNDEVDLENMPPNARAFIFDNFGFGSVPAEVATNNDDLVGEDSR